MDGIEFDCLRFRHLYDIFKNGLAIQYNQHWFLKGTYLTYPKAPCGQRPYGGE